MTISENEAIQKQKELPTFATDAEKKEADAVVADAKINAPETTTQEPTTAETKKKGTTLGSRT